MKIHLHSAVIEGLVSGQKFNFLVFGCFVLAAIFVVAQVPLFLPVFGPCFSSLIEALLEAVLETILSCYEGGCHCTTACGYLVCYPG